MYKVSIVVPVYNCEEYLDKCITSLINQTLYDCEFIFVNDGSSDNSRDIINKYKLIDNRITLINQENSGVSVARNKGIKVSTGEYIGFVDADDYIELDMFETMYNAAKESDCDVVISNFEEELEGNKNIIKYNFTKNKLLDKDYINKNIIPFFIANDSLNTAWNKIYKNKIIKDNKISFPKGVCLGEDGLFNINVFSNIDIVKYIDYCGYHYREVKGSATRNLYNKDYFEKALEVYNLDILNYCKTNLSREEIYKLKSIKFINSVMSYIYIYLKPNQGIDSTYARKYIKNMISNNHVQEALDIYNQEVPIHGRYEKVILRGIKRKSWFTLYCTCLYSRIRSK